MNERIRKVLIGTSALAAGTAAVGAVSHAVTKYMLKIALDRELPKITINQERAREQLVGSADYVAFRNSLTATTDKLANSGCEVVEIVASDGTALIGHWHACGHAKRIIIAMHGWRSFWAQDFGIIADFWHENDCGVLYVEQRGQGNSGGDYIGFGLLERYDCLDWINWVIQHCGDALPIYLAGVSMGATTVLMAAGLPLPSNVHGIIADCGFTSAHAIWEHVAKNNLHISYHIRSETANDLCRKKIQIGSKEYSTVEALAENTVPVLFIHGTEDRFVPVEMTYENYKACVAPKSLLIVPGAEHGMSYLLNKDGYEQITRDFWSAHD